MSATYYILVDKEAHPVFDIIKWGKWMEDHHHERRIARDVVNGHVVSTVFLGLDHGKGQGRPLLFETMAFREVVNGKAGNPDHKYTARFSTYDEALQGHNQLVSRLGGSNVVAMNE